MDSDGSDFGIRPEGADLGSLSRGQNKPDAAGSVPFGNVLQGMIDNVDSLQKEADASIRQLVAGEGVDVHNVAARMNEAEVAFDLMMEVRNKLLDAYRDIMKMQP